MALFQKAPRTREEYEQYPPLEVPRKRSSR
jgi:hypothetical protein